MPPARSSKHAAEPARGGAKRGAPPRLDATNLAGITALMNMQNVRAGADLDAAEQAVMGRTAEAAPHKKAAALDPVELYTKELNVLADELGIDFLDGDEGGLDEAAAGPEPKSRPAARADPPRAGGPRNPLEKNAIDALIGDLDLGSDSEYGEEEDGEDEDEYEDDDEEEGGDEYEDEEEGDEEDDEGDEDEDDEEGEDDEDGSEAPLSAVGRGLGIDLAAARRHGRRRRQVRAGAAGAAPPRPRLDNLTEEQERRRHINAVIGGMRHETRTSFGVEHERVQDLKASKLEQIGQLRMTLEEEGVDCSGVGAPTIAAPVEEIDSVLAVLKLKNDRNRYSSLAEEVILGFAEGVETVFDGTREVPVVGWKPDYTGYHNTVNVKLHRMRFETSQVVGGIIEKHNIGPTARIIMELLPSFFLYPRQQKKQRGAPGLHADFAAGGQQARVGSARSAYAAIRSSDTLGSVADL